ncbi:MAG: hypothetical protein KAT70_02410, partial [Thermoplasmata archaeon]|nr:hypothetical protein [Thermoplasmata archaeon]
NISVDGDNITVWSDALYLDHNPEVNWLYPDAGDGTVLVDTEYETEWDVIDQDGDEVTSILYYEDSGTGTRILIEAGLPMSGSHYWNTTLVDNGTYYLVLEARDPNGTLEVYRTYKTSDGLVQVLHPWVDISINPLDTVGGGEEFTAEGTAMFNDPSYELEYNVYVTLENDGEVITERALVLGENGQYTSPLTAPNAPGTYTIRVWADLGGLLVEENVSLDVILPDMPDLNIASDLGISPEEPAMGDTVSVDVLVKNDGSITGSSRVYLYVDEIAIGNEVDDAPVNVQAGGTEVITLEWEADEPGSHILWAAIDPSGLVDEEDETNNNRSGSVDVRQLPDFEILEANIIPSNHNPTEGNNVSFTIKLYNHGSMDSECLVVVY